MIIFIEIDNDAPISVADEFYKDFVALCREYDEHIVKYTVDLAQKAGGYGCAQERTEEAPADPLLMAAREAKKK